ncbi:hypothetical protein Vi05172_g2541 [Venturia inaequalis]|nr:hypothetical protein Vi05172_g2541 [Venturia inaequalis]
MFITSGLVTRLAVACTEQSHLNTKLMQGRQSSRDKTSRANLDRGAQSLLTLSATLNSLLIRSETKKWHGYRTKRSLNGKFVFKIELLAFLSWTAVFAAVLNEGAALHLSGRFDGIAKAMVAMVFFLCVGFGVSAWWGYRTALVRRGVVRRFGKVPEVGV